jgi:hypothetical protein
MRLFGMLQVFGRTKVREHLPVAGFAGAETDPVLPK